MTPMEWWHIYEAKHGKKTKRYGSLSHNDVDSLYKMMDKVGAFDGTSR